MLQSMGQAQAAGKVWEGRQSELLGTCVHEPCSLPGVETAVWWVAGKVGGRTCPRQCSRGQPGQYHAWERGRRGRAAVGGNRLMGRVTGGQKKVTTAVKCCRAAWAAGKVPPHTGHGRHWVGETCPPQHTHRSCNGVHSCVGVRVEGRGGVGHAGVWLACGGTVHHHTR